MAFLAHQSAEMNWVLSQVKEKDTKLAYQSPLTSTYVSFAYPYTGTLQKQTSPPSTPSSSSKISPTVLFIIVILAVVFFLSGLLHLLIRFLIKNPSSSHSSQSNAFNNTENQASDALQRQLQQLFHLHDSGLDQAFIDALPVFLYKEIMGLKEPFDCAVCLCEFSQDDKLRLLPLCSHAFHLDCIDTWLLSNSTCPLCRGTLFTPGLSIENPVFDFDDSREDDGITGDLEGGFSSNVQKNVEIEETQADEKRVLPVRLGKFRNLNEGGESNECVIGESSSSNLDARRCYSMGSLQYVVGDSNLQVALNKHRDGFKNPHFKRKDTNVGDSSVEMDFEGKKLWSGSKGESFSISKIWLWSRKGKFQGTSDNNTIQTGFPPYNGNLPWTERTQDM